MMKRHINVLNMHYVKCMETEMQVDLNYTLTY
jgi:hypothetical protein